MPENACRPIAVLTLALLAAACAGEGGQPVASDSPPSDPIAEVRAWRAQHERDYLRDYVSIAGLHFVETGVYRVGSDPTSDIELAHVAPSVGRLVVDGDTVWLEPDPGTVVTRAGQPVVGPIVMKALDTPPADEVSIGDVRLIVHESGARLSLRVRDPNGPLATGFLGFTWFPIDEAARVTGRFIADAEPRNVSVLNTFNDIVEYPTEGVVEFVWQGETLRLRPFTTRPGRLYFVFRDASGGVETYKTARFLYSDLQPDGTTVLDFNMAYNPPCAFNPYTTCPIPPAENVLPVKILAGERAYPVEAALPASD